MNEEVKEIVKEEKKSNKGILIIVMVILITACFVGGILVGGKYFNKKSNPVTENTTTNDNTNKNSSSELNEESTQEILKIVGIKGEEHDFDGIQKYLVKFSGNISEVDDETKKMLIYFYALDNNLISIVSGKESSLCASGSETCSAVSESDFLQIAKRYNITDSGDSLFGEWKYNDKYLYGDNNYSIDEKISHTYAIKKDGNDVVLTDNVVITNKEDNKTEKLDMTYVFKIDRNGKYSLYNVKSLSTYGLNYDIADIIGVGSNYDYSEIFLEVNGKISDASDYLKEDMLYYNALYNGKLETVGELDNSYCQAGKGSCESLAKSDYYDIARKYGLQNDANKLFGKERLYLEKYLFNFGGVTEVYTYTHNFSSNENNNELIVKDNLTITNIDTKESSKKEVVYTFKQNAGNYYLYSVTNE